MHYCIYSKKNKTYNELCNNRFSMGFSNMLRMNIILCTYYKPGFIEIDSESLFHFVRKCYRVMEL